jgi:hypothetical protein
MRDDASAEKGRQVTAGESSPMRLLKSAEEANTERAIEINSLLVFVWSASERASKQDTNKGMSVPSAQLAKVPATWVS